jgi:hypothetical protein
MSLVLLLALGIPAFVAAILIFVFTLVARVTARQRAALEQEGIVLDSGKQWITIRYANFRAPGIYRGAGLRKTRASLILTQQRLGLVPARRSYLFVPRKELGRFTVGASPDGTLQIHSDNPPGASGSIEYSVQLMDAETWVKALTDAGARPRAG